jgi:hypothetical protein
MNIDNWLQWPTKSTDPSLNAAIAVFLALIIIIALVIGATFLVPIVIVISSTRRPSNAV